MSMLLDDNVKAISTGIISQLDLDLCQCETFAVSEPVPGLGKGSQSNNLYRGTSASARPLRSASPFLDLVRVLLPTELLFLGRVWEKKSIYI